MKKPRITVSEVDYMVKQWDFEKNTFDIKTTSVHSEEKAFWHCKECNYKWEAMIKSRYRSSGLCPCHESNKVIKKGVNDVLALVPELAAEYDFENNPNVDIYREGVDSQKYVNWKCKKCGKSWSTRLGARIIKENDGYTFHRCTHYNTMKRKSIPVISEVSYMIKFWDFENNSLDPYVTKSNSHEYANWKCPNCSYSWSTQILTREQGSGKCPCCETFKVFVPGINDAISIIPELEKWFDKEKNKDIDIHSLRIRDTKTKYHWKCPDCGNSFYSSVASRIGGKMGSYSITRCKQCYINILSSNISPISSNPDMIKFWDYDKNIGCDTNLISCNSTDSYHWKCKKCTYEWEQTPHNRRNSKYCPCCEKGKAIAKGVNDLFTLYPELSEIYDPNDNPGLDIYSIGKGYPEDITWNCPDCGRKWNSTIKLRIKKDINGNEYVVKCSHCNRKQIRALSYAEEYPHLKEMWDEKHNGIPFEKVNSTLSTKQSFHWNCPQCGNKFDAWLNHMIEKYDSPDRGCFYCSGYLVDPKRTSLQAKYPKIAAQWSDENEDTPDQVFPTLTVLRKWHCDIYNLEYQAPINEMVTGEKECPYCSGKLAVPGRTSLLALYPDIAKMWSANNEKDADYVLPNVLTDALWICLECGNEFWGKIKEVVDGETDCPYCNNRKVMPGFNSFEVRHKDLIEEWDYVNNYIIVDPNTISDNHASPVWWICKNNKNHHYPMSVSRKLMYQKRNRESCPYCKGLRVKKRHFI